MLKFLLAAPMVLASCAALASGCLQLSPDKTGADIKLNGELADAGNDYILSGSGTQEWTNLAMLADCDPSTLLSSVPRVLPASAVAGP